MKPATHRGSCQICGNVQKLPDGVLSKHGYTKQWGFFSGTCPGSGWRPFEVAFDRIQGAITDTRQAVARLEAEAAALRTAPVELPAATAPFHDYNGRLGGYVESTVTVYADAERSVRFVLPSGRIEPGSRYSCFGPVEAAVVKLREQRCGRIARAVGQREQYIAWQEQRIREWAPAELQPVAAQEVTKK
jgi:hypothetical protein